MKRILSSGKFVSGIALVALLAWIGCSDNPSGPRINPLIGTWIMTEAKVSLLPNTTTTIPASETNNIEIVLRSDSSYSSSAVIMSQQGSDAGKWTSTDSKLTLTSINGPVHEIPYTLSGSTMTAWMKIPGTEIDAEVTLQKQ